MNYEKLITYSQEIYANQHSIYISDEKIQALSAEITDKNAENWDWELPEALRIGNVEQENAFDIAHYWFLTTAIQFCYWTKVDGEFSHWCYLGDPDLKGSSGMARMMQDFYIVEDSKGNSEKNPCFPSINNNSALVYARFSSLFRMAGIPKAEERADILSTLSNAKKFKQLFDESYDAINDIYTFDTAMAYRIGEMYPAAYKDVFLKKAQLLLAMLAANFRARGWKVQSELTVPADYRLSQVLRHLGIFEYSISFAEMVDSQSFVKPNGDAEKAIRAATIVACHELAKAADVTEEVVDAFLFMKTREDDFMKMADPFHLCITTNY